MVRDEQQRSDTHFLTNSKNGRNSRIKFKEQDNCDLPLALTSARRAKLVVRLLESGNLLRRAKDAIAVE